MSPVSRDPRAVARHRSVGAGGKRRPVRRDNGPNNRHPAALSLDAFAQCISGKHRHKSRGEGAGLHEMRLCMHNLRPLLLAAPHQDNRTGRLNETPANPSAKSS